MRSLLGRFHRPFARGIDEQLLLLNNLGDGSTLSLDFTTGVLDPRLTFTRSTTGTFTNASGLVASAAINTPRFDYDPTTLQPRGLLIEGSASNLFYWSESFETSGAANNWNFSSLNTTRGTVTTTNPAGISTTVVKIQETNAAGFHAPLIVYSSLTSSVYTISAFVKAAERQYIQLIDNGGSGAFGMFNLSGSGSVVSESAAGVSTITKYPDNWYRIVVRTPTLTNINVQFRLSTDGTTTSYTGTTGSGVYIWGAQLETGSGASSYIPTGASTGSRAEDTCYMDGTNFSSWYSASTQTGTLFADITHSALSNANGGIELGNGLGSQTTSNRVSLRRDAVIVDGVSSLTVSPTGASQRFKTAIAFAPGTSNTAACRNGGTVSNPAQAAGTLSGINALKLYIDASPALRPYGWIRQVKVWPINLSNATLQAITTL
jgi:hypothetical protein